MSQGTYFDFWLFQQNFVNPLPLGVPNLRYRSIFPLFQELLALLDARGRFSPLNLAHFTTRNRKIKI